MAAGRWVGIAGATVRESEVLAAAIRAAQRAEVHVAETLEGRFLGRVVPPTAALQSPGSDGKKQGSGGGMP